jgi:Predicted membrane protein
MNEPLKPRIDFDGPLEAEKSEQFRQSQTFADDIADKFAPAVVDETLPEEGRRKRLWNRCCVLNVACGARWSPPG